MNGEFKIIEFDCKMIMQVKIKENMTEDEIKKVIGESFDFVIEYGSSECCESDGYSAYITYKDEKNIVITNRDRL